MLTAVVTSVFLRSSNFITNPLNKEPRRLWIRESERGLEFSSDLIQFTITLLSIVATAVPIGQLE
jgi:hypothetical protein